MSKLINIGLSSILSIGLFAGSLTVAPSQITYDQPNEAIAVQAETVQMPEDNTISVVEASQTASTSLTPRPQTPTQTSVSRSTTGQKSIASTSNQKAAAIISTAKKYIGVNYVWGGTTPSGFDCSGYTQYVFAQNGISLPRISRDQFDKGQAVSFGNLKAGDLVFFSLDNDKVIDHVGIYIGNGEFINASTSKGVTIYPLGSYWKSHFVGAKRVL
ncbi:C40 family peptidase [Desulfitobacterium sp.]|nr:C40 family peptidase [Desulfitobacterium sp.]MEA4901082.1 C40 family peptidase [Desulfitobacterium sp.]